LAFKEQKEMEEREGERDKKEGKKTEFPGAI
jgi:hypothetical protein